MCICIEGPDQLSDDVLESVVDHYKSVKNQFNSTFKARRVHLDPQVDQGDFLKTICHDLFTSICFLTRLDTSSVEVSW